MALLEVRDLGVSFNTPDGIVHAVRGLSFDVDQGATLAVVGESGSRQERGHAGHHRPRPGARVTGSARLDGVELIGPPATCCGRCAGAQIGMIFQDPLSSLHPYYTVGWQIVEMIQAHRPFPLEEPGSERAAELLATVGIPNARRRINDYPPSSPGDAPRAMIAMAMALDPALLIADEPTTALDVTVQAQVLSVMRSLQQDFGDGDHPHHP